jgi:hypothetical protein
VIFEFRRSRKIQPQPAARGELRHSIASRIGCDIVRTRHQSCRFKKGGYLLRENPPTSA